MRDPHVVVLGGPNGAGKSTVAPRLLRDVLGVTAFVNADDIARGLSGFAPEAAALQAGRIMLDRLAALTRERATFAFESTLAGPGGRTRGRRASCRRVRRCRVDDDPDAGGCDPPGLRSRRQFPMTPTSDFDAPPNERVAGEPAAGTDVGALLADDAAVDAAVAAAQRDAVRTHRLFGRPVVVWRDGRLVEELEADESAGAGRRDDVRRARR